MICLYIYVYIVFIFAGNAPFGDSDRMSKFEIFNNINNNSPSFPLGMSSAAKALITGLLVKDPGKRFGWKDVSAAAWLVEVRSQALCSMNIPLLLKKNVMLSYVFFPLYQMNWESLLHQRICPPWIPSVGSKGDAS